MQSAQRVQGHHVCSTRGAGPPHELPCRAPVDVLLKLLLRPAAPLGRRAQLPVCVRQLLAQPAAVSLRARVRVWVAACARGGSRARTRGHLSDACTTWVLQATATQAIHTLLCSYQLQSLQIQAVPPP